MCIEDGKSCEHEEAVVRIMARIYDGAKLYSKIAVASVDTDLLISLLYHYEETWKTTSDQLQVWWITKSGDVKVVYPLHNICHKLVIQ